MVHGHFLAVFVFSLHSAAAANVKYALLGQTVILNPEIKASGANNILWKHNRDKVVEFNGNEQEVYPPFQDRISLDWHTAGLEITNLRYEDSGDYELEVFMNKEFTSFTFKLMVIDEVSKPSISCDKESGNRASLKCSAESSHSESLMKFEWSWRGSMQPGPNLTIPLGDENDDEEYNCTVSNPMSRETTTFSARDCYSETNLTWIIVGSVVAVIAVLLVVLGLLLFLKRRQHKPEQNRSDGEQETLMTPPSPQQPAGFAEENDPTEPVDVKKMAKQFQHLIDKRQNSTPAKPPGLVKALPPWKLNFSVIPQKSGINKHKKENNLDQVSGQLPQHPAGESSLEEKNQSDEENRIDVEQETFIGGLSTSQFPPQSPDCAQEDDDTEPDKDINSPPAKPPRTPKPPSPLPPDPSNIPDEGGIDKHKEDNNLDQISGKLQQNTGGEWSLEEGKHQREDLQGSKPENPHIFQFPNGADAAAANQAEKDDTGPNSKSTSDSEASDTKEEPAGQQEDQVPVTPGDAKDSEMTTETQTSGQTDNELDPEESKQAKKSHEDNQEENQQPESRQSSRQESHDFSTSAGSTTDAAEEQDKVSSRSSSQSKINSEETGGDEGERQNQQRDIDASEHGDSANSGQAAETSDLYTDENLESTDSTKESHTPQHS